jgi:cytochrome c5
MKKNCIGLIAAVALSMSSACSDQSDNGGATNDGQVSSDRMEPKQIAASVGRSGSVIVEQSCKSCHGFEGTGAPKIGDAKAWAPRLTKGEDALQASAIKGLNAMPPRGACADCTDDEIRSAIKVLINGQP